MTKIELNRLLGKIQLMKGLYEADYQPDCGFSSFLKPYVEEHWEVLNYEKVDLIVESHTLTALPTWESIDVNFTALLERTIGDEYS